MSNFHILGAIGRVLLIGGIALMLLAIAADPPLALVVLAGGGSARVWSGITAATGEALITGTAVATTGAGIHYVTGDGSGSGGATGGTEGVPLMRSLQTAGANARSVNRNWEWKG